MSEPRSAQTWNRWRYIPLALVCLSSSHGGLGREHPSPDTIPHLSQQNSNSGSADGQHGRGSISGPALTPTVSHGQAGSPVKESLLQRGTSVDEQDAEEVAKVVAQAQGGDDETGGVPIRR